MEKYTLEQHFVKMQDMVAQYLEPGSYPKDGAHCNAGDDDQKNGFFINDMIYMLDGPEQREAQSTPDELTSLKAENERLREALEDAKQSLSVAIYGLPEMLESNALSDEEGMVPSLEAAVSRMDEALGKAQQ